MSHRPSSRKTFARQLREELSRQKLGIRTLARRMDPERPETARRSLYKWLGGEHLPSRASREAVAVALGLPEDHFSADDDEEDALEPLTRDILAALYDAIGSALDRRVAA
jgi:transcriptional regulator with XRE-family HTH domain